jgi:hypothetical protein
MIFQNYNQAGLSVIPLRAKMKIPAISGWQKYNKEICTQEIAVDWDKTYKVPSRGNIGLCPGPASGVMAVDIDTDNPQTHKIVPYSPFVRAGKPGRQLRFYKYNPEITSMKDHSKGIEIFSNTGQVVLPPSIHPDTKEPYQWIGEMNLLDDEWREHLPEMQNLKWLDRCPSLDGGDEHKFIVGRNTRLTQIVCAILTRNESIETAIDELLKIDSAEHFGREYFSDMSETEARRSNGDPREAARIFVERHYAQLKGKGDIPDPIDIEIDLNALTSKNLKEIFLPLPKAPGLIGEIQEDILRYAHIHQPQLAYGGALALLSVCALGRYSWNGTWPNLYIMNMAPSGFGKAVAQDYIKEVLSHDLIYGERLIGQGRWQSNVAITMDFPEQRYRIDILDEFGKFLKTASKNDFKEEAMSMATELYSLNGRRFLGVKSAKRGKETGECIGPGLTVLASLQPDIFSNAATLEMFDSGFLRRFIYFISDQDKKRIKNIKQINADGIARKLKATILKRQGLYSGAPVGGFNADISSYQPNCLLMEDGPGVVEYRDEILDELFEIDDASNIRATENSMKIAMLSALACDRHTVTKDDLDFSLELVRALAYNSKRLLDEASSGSRFGKDQNRVIRWLSEKSGSTSTMQAFNNQFLDMIPAHKRDVLKNLVDRGCIRIDRNRIILTR